MRKRKSIFKVMVIIFAIMFVINAIIMRMLFGVNVIGKQVLMEANPAKAEPAQAEGDPAWAEDKASLYAITPDEVNSLMHLNLRDKITAASILYKLSPEEIDRIIRMAADGITFDEYEEIKTLAEYYLDPSDIEVLEEILFSSNIGSRSCLNQSP